MKTEKVLTEGLAAGYGGGKPLLINRAGFEGKQSHSDLPEDSIYHDEWFASRLGGGQELVRGEDGYATRVYGGGTYPEELLDELGTTEDEVMTFLVESINKLREKTRLSENCLPLVEGDWEYIYKVIEKISEIDSFLGRESIEYKGREVFIHWHIKSPIK